MKSTVALIILITMIIIPTSSLAQTAVKIEVDPNDSPLTISGMIGEANAFTGSLRLTAEGGDVDSFLFLPSKLIRQGGDEEIDRSNVILVGDMVLKAGIPKDFQVTVNGVMEPGTYEGVIEIRTPDQPRNNALMINLQVVAKTKPVLTPQTGTSPLQLKLVNCSGGVDCWLAGLLLPDSALTDERMLQFQNATGIDVVVTDWDVVANGENTGFQLNKTQLALPKGPQSMPFRQISSLPLTLHRDEMPSDHYTGALYLSLEGGDDLLSLPVDIYVRSGPLRPLIWLLGGVLLGRLFKYMQERGRPQSEALKSVNELTVRVHSAPDEDQAILMSMVKELRGQVYKQKLENIQAQIKVIEGRMEALAQLRKIESALKDKAQHPVVKEALGKVNVARQLIAEGKDEQAKTSIQEAQGLLVKVKSSLMGEGKPSQDVAEAEEMSREAALATGRAAEGFVIAPSGPAWLEWLKDALIQISGLSEQIRAEATLWLVSPLLYFALLFGLTFVGLSTLYVEGGLAFGSNPLADYTGLVIWGLSADVASRSLSNLRGG